MNRNGGLRFVDIWPVIVMNGRRNIKEVGSVMGDVFWLPVVASL